MNIVLIAVIVLGGTGVILASVIFLTARKFKVFEDPKIDEVQQAYLPQIAGDAVSRLSNLRGLCQSENLDGLFCPWAARVYEVVLLFWPRSRTG
jgi:hypothetical protein